MFVRFKDFSVNTIWVVNRDLTVKTLSVITFQAGYRVAAQRCSTVDLQLCKLASVL